VKIIQISIVSFLLFVSVVFIGIDSVVAQTPSFRLHILHTNDHHAHLEYIQFNKYQLGGIARRKKLIDKIRSDSQLVKEPILLLDAGDIFQGTLYFNQYAGQADLKFYNDLGYSASTIGNHEFDRGQQVLANFITGAEFPMISANIQIDNTSPLSGKIKPWTVIQIKGEKVGIFGLTTEETSILSNPGSGIIFTDSIIAAKNAVSNLKNQGVNKIIALTHIGIKADQELASQVNDIDVIVGGHSHTPVGNIPGAKISYPLLKKSPNGSKVLIVTAWEWGKYLGDISLDFDARGNVISWYGLPRPIDESIEPNKEFQETLKHFATPIENLRQNIIGKTNVLLDGSSATVRNQETNLGDLIADAMLDKLRSSGAEIAIFNSGNIRNSIISGDITIGTVLEVLPFGNNIALIDITGAQLKAALENGVSKVEENAGRFPQVAGLNFSWNSSFPVGKRVTSVKIHTQNGNYKHLNPQTTYRLVTNDFLLNGNDGYTTLKDEKSSIDSTGFILSDVVKNYITTHSPISLQVEGRISRGFPRKHLSDSAAKKQRC
jgi:5'-nucleotidase / UDP-sugar diphosphatase